MDKILQKRIEEAAHQYIQSDAVAPGNMQLAFGDFINGAKWALQNQWISVDEALPPHKPVGQNQRFSLPVILVEDNDVTTAFIDSYDFEQPSKNVTHWMHIPSLKGGEE